MLEAPRGLSHPQTSFIGTVCQGIHHTPFRAAHAPKKPNDSFSTPDDKSSHCKKMITKRSISKPDSKTEPGEIAIKQTMTKNHHRIARVHYPVLKPPRTQETIRTRHTGRPTAPRGHPENRTRPSRGWRSGNPKAYPYHCPQAPKRTREANDLFHTSTPTPLREPFPACGPHDGRQTGVLKKTP